VQGGEEGDQADEALRSQGFEPRHVPKAPEDQLADAIRQLAKGGVDEAQVRQLVTEEVKRQVIEEGITRIEVTVADHTTELPKLHHEVLPEVIAVLAQGLNVFLVGPAGSGKSTVAHQAAEALDLPFYAISLGPTTPTSKLFGFVDAQGQYRTTPFRTSYDDESGERAGVMLFDELDNGHPGLVAEINQATANGYCAFADAMVKRSARSRIVATGNTFGRGPDRLFVGRNILDAATLDRFVTIEVGIDERLERKLALAYANDDNQATIVDWIAYVQTVRRKVEEHKLPVVVSPRSTIDGAKLLAAGLTVERVKEIRLFAGVGNDVRAKIQ
jgi:MoxR-like ATPase